MISAKKISNKSRVLLKLTGESFIEGTDNTCIEKYDRMAANLINICEDTKTELAIVVGGGNLFRGRQTDGKNVDRVYADAMGIRATEMNGIGLTESLIRNGALHTKLMSALGKSEVTEPYNKLKGKRYLDRDSILVLCGGLGKSGFTTDSAAAKYASDLNCRVILKASTIDGVYDKDPKKNENAVKFKEITFQQALDLDLKVMDSTAFEICQKNNIKIFVFDGSNLDNIRRAVEGDYSFGTLVR